MTRLPSILVLVLAGLAFYLSSSSEAAPASTSPYGDSVASLTEDTLALLGDPSLDGAAAASFCDKLIARVEFGILMMLRTIRAQHDADELDCELWCAMYASVLDLVNLIELFCEETVGVQARRDLFDISLLLSECGC